MVFNGSRMQPVLKLSANLRTASHAGEIFSFVPHWLANQDKTANQYVIVIA